MHSSRRIPLALGSALALALLLGVVWSMGSFEPRYQGVPVNQYVFALVNTNRFVYPDAASELKKIGPTLAVPALINVVERSDSRVRRWYVNRYPRLPARLKKILGPPKSNRIPVQNALYCLAYLGPEARDAVPTLIRVFGKGDYHLQFHVVSVLGSIGPEARAALPILLQELASTNTISSPTPYAVIQGLSKIDPTGQQSMPALERIIPTANPFVRNAALDALGKMAWHSPHLASNLWTALYHDTGQVRVTAALHLQTLDLLTRESLEPLFQELTGPKASARASVAEILRHSGKFASDVIPALCAAADDHDTSVRTAALTSLSLLARETTIATSLRLQAAREVVEKGDAGAAWQMMDLIASVSPDPRSYLHLLIRSLKSDHERVRGKAAETLGRLGPAAQEAKPDLEKLLSDPWANVREAAQGALRAMQSAPSHAVTP